MNNGAISAIIHLDILQLLLATLVYFILALTA